MQWKTSISHITEEKEIIRGHDLQDLIKTRSFSETIFLVLKGTLPNENEKRMMDALFTASIDHGIGTPSAMTARITASTKNSMHTAVAAGILAMGELHGSAIEGAAEFFQKYVHIKDVAEFVKELKAKKFRIPGFGHKVFTDVDPRSETLFSIAKENNIFSKHCEFATQVGEELNKISSKKLPLNIDGAMGAIISDMGFDARMAKGFFIIGRVPGLVAHVYEEITEGEGIRRLEVDEAEFSDK